MTRRSKVPVLGGLSALLLTAFAAGAATLGPVTIGGGLSADFGVSGVAGIPARESPLTWTLAGDATPSIVGISLPFSFVLSRNERSFRQPFNQFGISPSWRWATLHLGYRNLTWSPYTLGGHTFLGGGVELNPGILRLGAVYGRLQRAVPEDTAAAPPDSVEQTPAYRRTGWAVKLGVGRPSNFVDLVFLKAADDSTSLPARPLYTVLMPAENAVVGLTTRQQIGRALVFDLDFGASVFTRDQSAQAINFDNATLKTLSRIIQPRVSTNYYFAGRTGLTLTLGPLSAVAQYERVEPEYQSMGANPLTTDLSRITVAPSLRLWSDRLNLSGSVGSQSDNLLGTKRATTTRLIWSAGAGVYPTPSLGLDVRYANYGTSQAAGTAPVNDSTRLEQVNQNLSITPRWTFLTGATAHSLSLSFNQTGLADANSYTQAANNSSATVAALSYGIGAAAFSASAAATWAATRADTNRTAVTGVSLTGTRPLLGNRLNLSLTPALAWTAVGGSAAATTLTVRADASFQPWPAHTFRAGLSFVSNRASLPGSESFSEFKFTTGYGFSF